MDGRGATRPGTGIGWEAALVVAQRVLDEDLDVDGDVTSAATVPPDAVARALIVAREPGVVAGTMVVRAVFDLVDPRISVELGVADGAPIVAGETLGEVAGPLRSVLAGIPSAIGLLAHLSGIATRTSSYVDAVDGTGCEVGATRRSTPGLRALEHAAVRVGGGVVGRAGLHDALLVGAGHVAAAGSLAAATRRAMAAADGRPVVVEVRAEQDVVDAVDAGARAVRIVGADARTAAALVHRARGLPVDADGLRVEVAGDLDLGAVRTYATTGADRVVLPRLIEHAVPLDIGSRVADRPPGGVSEPDADPGAQLLFTDRRGED